MTEINKGKTSNKKGCIVLVVLVLIIASIFSDEEKGGELFSNSDEKSYTCKESDFTSALIFNFEKETDDGPSGTIILTIQPEYVSKPIGFKGKYIEASNEGIYDGIITISHMSSESDGEWEKISEDVRENVIFYQKVGEDLILSNQTSMNPALSFLENSKFVKE
jgi:hypothetical protein